MATDITTLAIALQSKEAESSLKAFNDLLTTGSANAKKMENMSIGVDVSAALKELAALKAGYDDIAKSAANIHFDLGMNMPTMLAPPAPTTPPIDTAALEEMKAFFQTAAEEMRKEAERVSESMNQMGAGAERAGESVRTAGASVRASGESMRGAGAAAGEYAKKLREVNAAKKEMEKLDAKAAMNRQAARTANDEANAIKEKLKLAQERLDADRERMKFAPDYQIQKHLIRKVQELSEAYEKARKEAEKFDLKLKISSDAADQARERYAQLQAELNGIPAPTGKARVAVDNFGKNAKQVGTTVTKLARGFNAVAFAGGAAVPGLTKAGMAISMFAYSGPVVGAAIIGIGLLASHIKSLNEKSEKEVQFIRDTADRAMKNAQAVKQFLSESEKDWNRLGELANVESLSNAQNEEATAILQRLAEVYGDLGIEIDKTTGKLMGYGLARDIANAKDRAMIKSQMQVSSLAAQQRIRAAEDAQNMDDKVGAGVWDTIKNLPHVVSFGLIGKDSDFAGKTAISRDLEFFLEEIQKGGASFEDQYTKVQQKIVSLSNELLKKGYLESPLYTDEATGKTVYEQINKEAANAEIKYLQELSNDLADAMKAERILKEFDTSPIEEYSKAVGKITAQLNEQQSKLIEEDGKLRLKTAEEVYQAQKARIAEIGKEIEKNSQINEMATLDNGKQAGVYLKELELERSNLLEKTLTYEQRISEEKAKQTKALNDAINADQMRLNQFKVGFITDKNGDIIRKKNADELAADREEEIKSLQALIKEKGYGNTLEEEKELVAARLKLAQLQAEDMKYRDQVAAAGKKNEDARKGYVFSEYTGSVLRKKTEDELQRERENEIEAARARVKATEEGTLERAQAQAELDRLAIEEYNARKKTGANAAVQEANTENSRLVRGIEARSTEAMALEARSFRRDDSEKAILKDTKNVQTDIKGLVQNVLAIMTNMGANFSEISENIQPL